MRYDRPRLLGEVVAGGRVDDAPAAVSGSASPLDTTAGRHPHGAEHGGGSKAWPSSTTCCAPLRAARSQSRPVRGGQSATPDALRRAVAQFRPDAVVHLAAMHFISAVDRALELAWDAHGTAALLVALESRPQLLLFASPRRARRSRSTSTGGRARRQAAGRRARSDDREPLRRRAHLQRHRQTRDEPAFWLDAVASDSPKICSGGDRLGDSEATSRAVSSQSDLFESTEARERIYHDPNCLVRPDGDVEEIPNDVALYTPVVA
jgi:hypothetical protein